MAEQLNPSVVLAALDAALERPTTHPRTHLSMMRLRVKRLRDHVEQYVGGPTVGFTLTDEEVLRLAQLHDAPVARLPELLADPEIAKVVVRIRQHATDLIHADQAARRARSKT